METTFSIQQVAELTGLSIDTLRYYERIRLLEPVSRAPSGHRQYKQKDLDWIGLLINLRETGMPLAEMLHFAELRRQGNATASERLRLLEHHQRALEQRMQKLEQHMVALQQKIAHKKAFLVQRNVAPFPTHASGGAEAKLAPPEPDVNLNTQEEQEC
jgi:DNA-binding transcriptional MerR regulator